MPQKHTTSRPETIRLTIDFPADQHTYIKMLATSEGMSLRQFVIEHLPTPERKKRKRKNIAKGKFDKLLKEFVQEKRPMLKRLAKR